MELHRLAQDLLEIVDGAERKLLEFTDQAASEPRAAGKWSRKQILGHLIDSAANNHQRFIRLQLTVELTMLGTNRRAGCE